MTIHYETPQVQLLHGDAHEQLRTLEAESVQCVVTSPPYFGLRDYGVEGSPEEFIDSLVSVFSEVRRVLRADGTLWVNIGDTYATRGGPGWQGKNGQRSDRRFTGTRNTVAMREHSRTAHDGFKPKDMLGIPWMLAFALRADGWWLRQDIIWAKPNPTPEAVTDRCTKAHEYLFLLTRSERYFYDNKAIQEPVAHPEDNTPEDHARAFSALRTSSPEGRQKGYQSGNKERKFRGDHGGVSTDLQRSHQGFGVPWEYSGQGRNKRSVWSIPTSPFPEAHFATFPPALVEPCILAGSKPGDLVLDPFVGSGTTAMVARDLGRRAVGIDLNTEYLDIAIRRVGGQLALVPE